jgi:hypothetical protein
MVKVGAPVPLAIMVMSWGAVSAGTAGIKTVGEFYLVRFLLGICEGGCVQAPALRVRLPGRWHAYADPDAMVCARPGRSRGRGTTW